MLPNIPPSLDNEAAFTWHEPDTDNGLTAEKSRFLSLGGMYETFIEGPIYADIMSWLEMVAEESEGVALSATGETNRLESLITWQAFRKVRMALKERAIYMIQQSKNVISEENNGDNGPNL